MADENSARETRIMVDAAEAVEFAREKQLDAYKRGLAHGYIDAFTVMLGVAASMYIAWRLVQWLEHIEHIEHGMMPGMNGGLNA